MTEAAFSPAASPTTVPVIRTFLASATYTPTPGMVYCIVEMVGGGGGSSGHAATTGAAISGGAGGAGAYIKALLTAAQVGASQVITIGAGGTAGAASNTAGGNGGNTTFGALLNAQFGQGGIAAAGQATSVRTAGAPGGTPTVTTGTALVTRVGEGGEVSWVFANGANSFGNQGTAGRTPFGGVATPTSSITTATGNIVGASALANTGGGATASMRLGAGAAQAGAAGGSGRVVITEYF